MKKRSLRTPFDFIARSQFLHSSRQRTRRSTGNSIMLNAEGKNVYTQQALVKRKPRRKREIPFTQPVALERRGGENYASFGRFHSTALQTPSRKGVDRDDRFGEEAKRQARSHARENVQIKQKLQKRGD